MRYNNLFCLSYEENFCLSLGENEKHRAYHHKKIIRPMFMS